MKPNIILKSQRVLLAVLLGCLATATYAQTSTDESDWPEDVDTRNYDKAPEYFNMNKSTNPILKKYVQLEQADNAAQNGQPSQAAKQPAKKKGKWPLQKKQKIRPLTDEQVTRVGPRETMPARDPLLALPVSLELPNGGSLPSGFYLVRQEPLKDPASDSRQLFFVKENKTLFACAVHRTGSPVTNADSPLSVTNPQLLSALSPVIKVIITPANENRQQTATLVFQMGGDRFESEPFPVISDKRPPLRAD